LVAADERLWLSLSWTTRARRPGEPEDAYTFVDRVTFLGRVAEGGFLEWATILGEYYGTPTPEPREGRDIVLEIDVQGARQVLERRPDAHCVLIRAPSPEVQEQRLRSRGDSEEHIKRRIALGRLEEAEGLELASHVVVNDDLDGAVRDLADIVEEIRPQSHTRPC
jgi:guanylate kinase